MVKATPKQVGNTTALTSAVDIFSNTPGVTYEPDVNVSLSDTTVNKVMTAKTASTEQFLTPNIKELVRDASYAGSGTGSGKNVNATVAVIDTGIDFTHPESTYL